MSNSKLLEGEGDSLASMRLRRRSLLAGSGALFLGGLAGCRTRSDSADSDSSEIVAPDLSASATVPSQFLTEAELTTLRAFVERMIPADVEPGASAAGCADAIDFLLGAFQAAPSFIYAGAPFSDRGGREDNLFRSFIPLDAYEALGWRIAIEGSQGIPEREFNGPVKGLQAIYREGLAQLNARAAEFGFADFAAMPAATQDLLLNDSNDVLIQELVDVGFGDTLDAMYGAPEYGGNQNQAGWGFTAYPGDVQPRGYTDDEVVNADNPGPLDFLLPPSYHDPARRTNGVSKRALSASPLAEAAGHLLMVPPMESLPAMIQAAEGRLSRLRALLHKLPIKGDAAHG